MFRLQQQESENLNIVLSEEVLGTGAFATIFKGRLSEGKDPEEGPHTSSEVAVKVLRKQNTANK